MTTKHTKGPWRYDYEPGYCGELIAADGSVVCVFTEEPGLDDAKVLAAAPDLLEALQETQSLLTAMLHEQRPQSEVEAQIAENRAAIAKATGGQP
ncbi:hypothetical protein RVU96_17695 [Bordetella avium]|uniref:hypothetical protein n=1 Tax=Bordetella avium TaxID=521 RepID=UPI000E0B6434|nr:hypothetical protein [Bordetella avium]UOK17046.1 Ead/Ea22-like protein [Bordetella phage vB_BaM-IFTN1]UOK17174.1 Ead/Ea22-like protein [Bordetella phage vB_BaM-IFTN3]UOK17379.1 Ead/Ea22-like protein [Bordetella phage vB_BaM-IFTN6]UOK17444.1 Ead/Ea22-like protein [Bordetella phage vB_BaM-IFTN7]UOK17587.1 Ead/Ea22-like protein [Bordetella phage vB_BaM-IFTN9]